MSDEGFTMGLTRTEIKVCSTGKPELCRIIKDVIVDTGAVVSAIPLKTAEELEISFPIRRTFTLADGSKTTKPVGSAIIEVDGQKAIGEIITSDKPLLGVTILEQLGLKVDPSTGKLTQTGALLL
jgi:clan AA aspartic protease